MDKKLNVLFNSEFSQSATGYGKMAKEVMTRLYNTDKYNLAEIAGYCEPNDPRIDNVPWKLYPTLPHRDNKEEILECNSHPQNPQGRWKFNLACLDFQPDINIMFRDAWYDSYIEFSPFRHLFHLLFWNPVDGIPLEPNWIAKAIESDSCFTYTEWGYKALKRATNNKGNIIGPMPLGVDPKVFYPIFNKVAVKEHFGFKSDTLVIGFVCRNQPRKLIAVLLESFTNFLLSSAPEISSKCFLYLHTAWPDLSWNIPQLLKDYGIGNKVLFTYQCKNCQAVYPTVYSDIGTVCMKCGCPSIGMSKSSDGVSDETMNYLYNFMDCYCQTASNEGLGIPAIEAIACTVPTLATDYSGTVDIINKAGAIPIKSMKLIREMEGGSNRYISVPDVENLTKQIKEIMELPDSLRRSIGYKQYLKSKVWFTWDNATNILMKHIDTVPKKNWAVGPSRIHRPDLNTPNGLSVEEYVWWLYHKVMGRPELYNSYKSLRLTYEIMFGISGDKPNFRQYNKDMALQDALGDLEYYNKWESERVKRFGVK